MRSSSEIVNKAEELIREYNTAKDGYDRDTKLLEQAKLDCDIVKEALAITQTVAQQIQQEAHKQVAGIVTHCLSTVFPEPYEFKIHFDRKRGKTEARMVFVREGEELDPLTAAGLGVADVACFALRLAALVIAKPQRRRLLVLDEPFRFLSMGHRTAIKTLIETLSTEMGIQFIIVTHLPELEMGTILRL